MASLLSLPPELHYGINSHLPPLSLHSLSQTSRYFNTIIGPIRLSKKDTLALRIELETPDATRYHRVCSKCLRLRQFYHYSIKHASERIHSDVRTCLDCFPKTYDPRNRHQRIRWFLGTMIAVCPDCSQLVRCLSREKPTIWIPRNRIIPHVCKLGKDPDPLEEGGKDPSVNRVRATLDRLEAGLPHRYLSGFRPGYYWGGINARTDLDEILEHLKGCAAERRITDG
ncbi:hypothetical protein BDD12DRAFT_827780 [Trichophaea hybrida]|nr:hypothetical protein BDD12DRAFT_827780 [Trichophaea hybrida]